MPEAREPDVFDTGHHASTLGQKLVRALQLGPNYYLKSLPAYFKSRRERALRGADFDVFISPLREFQRRPFVDFPLPPGFDEALKSLARTGMRLALPRVRVEALVSAWWQTRALEGDFIECGSYQGATSLLIALLAERAGLRQKVLSFDTFAGMPDAGRFDLGRAKGEFSSQIDQVEAIHVAARALGVEQRIEVYKGLFADSFRDEKLKEARLAFAHIDANLYQGTFDACQFCLPRLVPGGIVVFDDYGGVLDLGARLAIDESLAPLRKRPSPLAGCSAYLRV